MSFGVAFIIFLGLVFFATAIYAIWWSAKTGQWKKLEEGAKTIFNEEEPEGKQTDFFPKKKKNKKNLETVK